jgi:hypothetical protein
MNLPGLHCSKHWACAEDDLHSKVTTAVMANKLYFIVEGHRNDHALRLEIFEGFKFTRHKEFMSA